MRKGQEDVAAMNYSHLNTARYEIGDDTLVQSPQLQLPGVSVVVTCFNYARFVVDALDSVLAQTYKNFECVIVDDASTDQSAVIIEEWLRKHSDPRFQFIRSPVNRGQTASFSVGLAAGKGEFVAFLDADDFWFPTFLQQHIEAHLNRDGFVSLSCSDMLQVDEERRVIAGTMGTAGILGRPHLFDEAHVPRCDENMTGLHLSENASIELINSSFREIPWTATSGMMFRRSALVLLMPERPDELRICSDWYIFVLCHYFTGSLLVDSSLGAYRRHRKNNFADNPVLSFMPSAESAIARHRKVVVRMMLEHLVNQRDKFATIFAGSDVNRLIGILYAETLREGYSASSLPIARTIGLRSAFKIAIKAKLSFLRRFRFF
ncbi:MAG: glycosyltransferase [Bradyrhizobium sp.]|uniref:glycosyltransferase n=1 Tax=Bradyrhizobium sp. TaxID=376 RepID=UPI0029B7AF22|nr:glycosyltransferase [Bradyrhizobium sp.]MDX3969788.1 glycosyltransferase [Bradyrhizobium sp.]